MTRKITAIISDEEFEKLSKMVASNYSKDITHALTQVIDYFPVPKQVRAN